MASRAPPPRGRPKCDPPAAPRRDQWWLSPRLARCVVALRGVVRTGIGNDPASASRASDRDPRSGGITR